MNNLLRTTPRALWLIKGVLICIVALVLVAFQERWFSAPQLSDSISSRTKNDSAMPLPEIPSGAARELMQFGRELIKHTGRYLGPQGKFRSISNGVNGEERRFDAGARPFAGSFCTVVSWYPKFRSRPGTVLSKPGQQ